MSVKTIKIVTVKHPGMNVPFTFKVPETLDLCVGDRVLVNTKKAQCEMARCITPSFKIDEPVLMDLYGLNADKLMPVVGFLRPIMYVFENTEKD